MEPVETRSDTRSKFNAASPADIWAAMSDPQRIADFVAVANEQNLQRLAAEVQRVAG